MIMAKDSNNKGGFRCSGYGVFPDGKKCKGCSDCGFGKKVKSVGQIKRDLNKKLIWVKK